MDASSVQQITGVCPQHDLLWSDLTAREHIYLTAAFKGIESGEPLEIAVKKMLTKMNLFDRADSCVADFSGGMQRRLSVAMSLSGIPALRPFRLWLCEGRVVHGAFTPGVGLCARKNNCLFS